MKLRTRTYLIPKVFKKATLKKQWKRHLGAALGSGQQAVNEGSDELAETFVLLVFDPGLDFFKICVIITSHIYNYAYFK